MSIRVLIVDDDERERIILRYLLDRDPDVEVVGQASGGKEALFLAREKKPDLVFMDIVMPEVSGVETARQLAALPMAPLIAFVTLHADYAMEAFELGAIDYILKPFDPPRLARTLERARRYLMHEHVIEHLVDVRLRDKIETAVARLRSDESPFSKLPVRDKARIILLEQAEIVFVESERKKSVIYVAGGSEYTATYTLNELESRLDKSHFLRVHQGFIVNLGYVRELLPRGDGSYIIAVSGFDKEIPLSRARAADLRRKLGV